MKTPDRSYICWYLKHNSVLRSFIYAIPEIAHVLMIQIIGCSVIIHSKYNSMKLILIAMLLNMHGGLTAWVGKEEVLHKL